MAEVTLHIAGRAYIVGCRDGGEAELEALGRRLDAHSDVAARVSGGGDRTMLFIALMLADQLAEAEKTPKDDGGLPTVLDRVAEQLESLAETLEKSPGRA